MKSEMLALTGVERTFAEDEIIVSKTDPTGRLTYVNEIFTKVSGYTENDVLGQQHAIVRHPEMPRCVFRLLWDTLGAGKEIFAYVNNRAKNGDNYWVFAHVTPTFGPNREIIGYHSNRRVPKRTAIGALKPLYAQLLAVEQRENDRKRGLEKSHQALLKFVTEQKVPYDELILSL